MAHHVGLQRAGDNGTHALHAAIVGPERFVVGRKIPGRIAWSELPARAKAWRLVHATWSVAQLASLSYVWTAALSGRRGRGVWGCVAFLLLEGGALLLGRGNCPVGRLQAEWGDPVPFFELLLPPRAAKAAIPVLALASLVGIAALVLLPPGFKRKSRGAGRA